VQPERIQAGLYLIFYTGFGSVPLLVRLLSSLSQVSLRFVYLFGFSLSNFDGIEWGLIIAFLIKMPIYGVHV
jgi:NADH-ubiquinone oxidoreductase chain 4